ncbi:MAG: PhoD-like phosphatase N-terminal domain-containing protein [Actinobacteria bacterium]|nr:PhoD-like phosphatase N-terminal domain-containing protein [Actinomycetota bacterium]
MEPFRHAVASFEPTSSGVLLWTRLTAAVEAEWVIARDPELVDVVASGRARTTGSTSGGAGIEAGAPGSGWVGDDNVRPVPPCSRPPGPSRPPAGSPGRARPSRAAAARAR